MGIVLDDYIILCQPMGKGRYNKPNPDPCDSGIILNYYRKDYFKVFAKSDLSMLSVSRRTISTDD
jgi:hypothetical protein